jgi:Pex19 protein family
MLNVQDLMYDPMKQVAVRFPKWLEERRSSLSAQELKKYVPDQNNANDIFSSVAHPPIQLQFSVIAKATGTV